MRRNVRVLITMRLNSIETARKMMNIKIIQKLFQFLAKSGSSSFQEKINSDGQNILHKTDENPLDALTLRNRSLTSLKMLLIHRRDQLTQIAFLINS